MYAHTIDTQGSGAPDILALLSAYAALVQHCCPWGIIFTLGRGRLLQDNIVLGESHRREIGSQVVPFPPWPLPLAWLFKWEEVGWLMTAADIVVAIWAARLSPRHTDSDAASTLNPLPMTYNNASHFLTGTIQHCHMSVNPLASPFLLTQLTLTLISAVPRRHPPERNRVPNQKDMVRGLELA